MGNFPILSFITFLPVVGMVIILCLPKSQTLVMKCLTLVITGIQVILAGFLLYHYNYGMGGINNPATFQYIEKFRWIEISGFSWIGKIKIDYFLGIDGLSIPMVLLTAIISFVATLASWKIEKAVKGYFALYLLLITGMMGMFVALDFFLFYGFWELMLLPMYFLIGIWGGPRREYAAIKFFLYTLLGSVFILLVVIGLYFSTMETMIDGTKVFTFNMLSMMDTHNFVATGILSPMNPHNLRFIAYIALFIGFAIKIPAFPFHTWLPDAHVEAPTAISVILADVLLKMGTYGILRVNFAVLPAATYQLAWLFLGVIGTINIVYGAMCAMAQTDYKKLIAYSSISHMGYVMLGMAAFTAAGINGAVLQMFNHGTITAMLFILVGVIYDRAHHREINGFGGLAQQMPIYTAITGFAFFAGMGLPGMSTFISAVLVLLGAWQTHPVMVVFGAATAVLTAGYLLWTFQRIYLGPLNEKYKDFPDLSFREAFTLVPLGIIVLILGVYPHAILGLLNTSLVHLNQVVLSTSGAAVAMVR